MTSPRPDTITLTGLRVHGFHGVFEHERREGQDFVVDVVLHLDTRAAAAGDDLTRTVHYGELAQALAADVRRDPVDLIETLAERLARTASADGRVAAVDVTVHKPRAPIAEEFADVAVRIRRSRAELHGDPRLAAAPDAPVEAVLALGSNLGDRAATLASAVRDLGSAAGVAVRAVSPVFDTDPQGGPPGQPPYLNAVVLLATSLSPLALLDVCQAVEQAHHRERLVRWGPRTLDVDVVDYAGLVADSPRLTLPHPRAAGRAFVLAPWLAADAGAVLPGPQGPLRVAELLPAAPDAAQVRRSDVVLDAS